MSKSNLPYLQHMRDAAKQIQAYLAGMNWAGFQKNPMVQDAIIRKFEIIGEASKHVSSDFKKSYPELPWVKMASMRDRLIHGYFALDLYTVWQTATFDVPPLTESLIRIVKKLE